MRAAPQGQQISSFTRLPEAGSRLPKLLPRALGLPWLLLTPEKDPGMGTLSPDMVFRQELETSRRPNVAQVVPGRSVTRWQDDAIVLPARLDPVRTQPAPRRFEEIERELEFRFEDAPLLRPSPARATRPNREQTASAVQRVAPGLINPPAPVLRPAQLQLRIEATPMGLRIARGLRPIRPENPRYNEKKSRIRQIMAFAISSLDRASEFVDFYDVFAANVTTQSGRGFSSMSWPEAFEALRAGDLQLDVAGFAIDYLAEAMSDLVYGIGPGGRGYGVKTAFEKASQVDALNGKLSDTSLRDEAANLIADLQERAHRVASPVVFKFDL